MCAGPLLGEGIVAEDRSSGTHRSPRRRWLFAAICGVVVVQVLYGFLVIKLVGPHMDVRGQFGDLFGGVNALFTGLAFAGVIYTILLQSNELELQRKELRLNREVSERSADAQSEQVERLEEAAELSAISTLVNTYVTQLQPLREATQPTRVEIEKTKLFLENPDVNQAQKREASIKLEGLQGEIDIQRRRWSDKLRKEEELVARLEMLIGQKSQGNGEAQKPE